MDGRNIMHASSSPSCVLLVCEHDHGLAARASLRDNRQKEGGAPPQGAAPPGIHTSRARAAAPPGAAAAAAGSLPAAASAAGLSATAPAGSAASAAPRMFGMFHRRRNSQTAQGTKSNHHAAGDLAVSPGSLAARLPPPALSFLSRRDPTPTRMPVYIVPPSQTAHANAVETNCRDPGMLASHSAPSSMVIGRLSPTSSGSVPSSSRVSGSPPGWGGPAAAAVLNDTAFKDGNLQVRWHTLL